MRGITHIAKKAAGRSHMCSICPIMRLCTPAMGRACTDAFVEGFKKGARLIEKLNKTNK